jgi:hypothetical protein
VCKFLAGAFFVNAEILFYLYLAGVSVPLQGTAFIETPEVSGVRSVVQEDVTGRSKHTRSTQFDTARSRSRLRDTSASIRPLPSGAESLVA